MKYKKDTTTCYQCEHMCEEKACSHTGKPCNYIHKQYGMKRWVFNLIIIVISLGAIVPFALEVVCTLWFPDASLGLATWNQFVSIILGVVATLLSIVSMIMGFKNYDDTLRMQEKYTETIKDLGTIQKDIAIVKNKVSDIVPSGTTSTKEEVSATEDWGNEPKTKM